MPTLPDVRDLPGYRVQPAYQPPNYPENPIPRALDNLGNSIGGLGSTLARNTKIEDSQAREKAENAEKFYTNARLLQFQQNEDQLLHTAGQDVQPGAGGFTDKVVKDYFGRAKEFFASVPEALKPEVNQKLLLIQDDIRTRAQKFQDDEGKRFAVQNLNDAQTALLEKQRQNPAAWGTIRKEGETLIDEVPGLTAIERDDAKHQWRLQQNYTWGKQNPGEVIKALDAGKQSNTSAGVRMPVITGTQQGRQPLNMQGVKADVVDKWELTQGAFGKQVPIVSGYRDAETNAKAGGAQHSQHMDGNAIDIDVSGLSKEERRKLIADASAAGFTGIGVYQNSLHLDTGNRRVWGPDHHAGSVPGWALSATSMHMAGARPGPAGTGQVAASPSTIDELWPRLINQESGGKQSAVSPKGATGVAQVMPSTGPEAAKLAGVPWDPERFKNDRAYNEQLGKAYLGEQMRAFGGNPAKALAAYNAGPGAVQDAISKYGSDWLQHLPSETQNYVASILGGSSTPSYRGGAVGGSVGGGPGDFQYHALPPQLEGVPYDKLQDIYDSAIKGEQELARQGQQNRRDELALGIQTGAVTDPGTILNDTVIDDGDKAVLLKSFNEANATKISTIAVGNAINAGTYLDGTDPSVKKGLNGILQESGGPQALISGDRKAFANTMFVWRKAGLMADDAKVAVQQMLRSQDDDTLLRGAEYLDAFQRENPVAFRNTFGDEGNAVVMRYGQLNDIATPPQDIAKALRDRVDPVAIKAQEPLRKVAEDYAAKNFDLAAVVGLYDTRGALNYFTSAPGAPDGPPGIAGSPDALVRDFRTAYVEQYVQTGDATLAKANALKVIQNIWSPSVMNGGRITQFPPEKFYPSINGGYDYYREELELNLRQMGYVEKQAPVPVPTGGRAAGQQVVQQDPLRRYEVRLHPLVGPAQIANGQPPQYMVTVHNEETGNWDAVLGKNGLPMRWPDPGLLKRANDAAKTDFQSDHTETLDHQQRVEKAYQNELSGEGATMIGTPDPAYQ